MHESVVNDVSSILRRFPHAVISLKDVYAVQASHTALDTAIESDKNRA